MIVSFSHNQNFINLTKGVRIRTYHRWREVLKEPFLNALMDADHLKQDWFLQINLITHNDK